MDAALAGQLLLQVAAPLPYVGVGLAALAIERRMPDRAAPPARAWRLVGLAFLLSGGGHLAQSLWAAAAVAAGPESAVYAAYLRWTPAQNHSRALMMLAFGVALALLPRLSGWRAPALLLGGMVVGAALGWAEGGFQTERHFPLLSALDTLQLLVVLGALAATLHGNRVDRHLWLLVALYAVGHASSVIWLAALSWAETPGAWAPNALYLQGLLLLGASATLAVALRRLWLARRDVAVPGPLEPFDAPALRTLG